MTMASRPNYPTTPVAFFMGPRAKELAEELRDRRTEDGDPLIFDPAIAPAALVSEVGERGGLFAANHYDDAEGIAALVRLGLAGDDEAWT